MADKTGKFVWFECVTADSAKAQAFYGEVIGWKTQPFPMGEETYTMLAAGETPVGGYTAPEGPLAGAPPHWTSYVLVADVDATLKKITSAGGKILQPAFDVPGIGRMSQVADPQGASFWVMAGEEEGAPDAPATHGQFHWNELWARDADKVVPFYEKVLGYKSKAMAMPDGTYHVLEKGGLPRAGIMTAPPDAPSAWLPYVAVDDCDAAVERASKNGGSIQVPATDIPNIGRFAVFTDPNGATLAVIKPA